jgi:DNA-binding MarR family transcriptional regulator
MQYAPRRRPGPATRAQAIDEIARALPQRAALVTRLFVRQAPSELSRTEAGLLSTLSRGPRRITELAGLEGLAQPTITLLVKRLEERGWVARERDGADGRAVLVALTDAGRAALEGLRAQISAALHERVADMSDADVDALRAATDALETLIDALQQPER